MPDMYKTNSYVSFWTLHIFFKQLEKIAQNGWQKFNMNSFKNYNSIDIHVL